MLKMKQFIKLFLHPVIKIIKLRLFPKQRKYSSSEECEWSDVQIRYRFT